MRIGGAEFPQHGTFSGTFRFFPAAFAWHRRAGSRFRSVRLVQLRLYVNRKGLSCGRLRAANPAFRAAHATIAQDRRKACRGDIIPLSSPFALLVGFLSFVRTEVVRALSDRFQAVRTSTDHHQATRLRCDDRNGRDGNASEHMAPPPRKLFLPCATARGRWIALRARRKTKRTNPSIACVAALSPKLSWPAHAGHPGGEVDCGAGSEWTHRIGVTTTRTNWVARMRGP